MKPNARRPNVKGKRGGVESDLWIYWRTSREYRKDALAAKRQKDKMKKGFADR
jgi:hypothetical protein